MNAIPTTAPGLLLVVSGPSGAGKSTVIGQVRRQHPEIAFSVSCTTRAPRPGEVDGRDYHFLSQAEFQRRIEAGEFLEHARVHGNGYGTLRHEVESRIRDGGIVLLDIDVQGQRLVRQAILGTPLEAAAVFVFFAPPSFAELERRLRLRRTDSETDICRRLDNARAEMEAWREYDFIVVNDAVETAAATLAAIVTAARSRTPLMPTAPFDDATPSKPHTP